MGWCCIPFEQYANIKPKFFAALRVSVEAEGFRNPIVVYAMPEGIMLSFGGSRLRVAQQLKLQIPCIIADLTGEFAAQPEVTVDNYGTFFRDVPKHFVIDEYGVDTHYSLERNRRNECDLAGLAWTHRIRDTSFIKEEFSWIPTASSGKQTVATG